MTIPTDSSENVTVPPPRTSRLLAKVTRTFGFGKGKHRVWDQMDQVRAMYDEERRKVGNMIDQLREERREQTRLRDQLGETETTVSTLQSELEAALRANAMNHGAVGELTQTPQPPTRKIPLAVSVGIVKGPTGPENFSPSYRKK